MSKNSMIQLRLTTHATMRYHFKYTCVISMVTCEFDYINRRLRALRVLSVCKGRIIRVLLVKKGSSKSKAFFCR